MENFWYLLPALACPVGMGLMMWLMMRRDRGQSTGGVAGRSPSSAAPPDRLAQLRGELDDVRRQQEAIAARITELSTQPAPRSDLAEANVAEATRGRPSAAKESRP